MRSHAIANGVFVAAVNRTGVEGSRDNRVLGRLVRLRSAMATFWPGRRTTPKKRLLVECDLSQIDSVRTHWPFLRDRRIDAYSGLLKRYLD